MNCPNQIWHTANQKTSICKHPHPHHKIPLFVEPPLSSDLALSLASRISPFSSISWSLRLVTLGHLSQYYQMVFITYICFHCITTYQMNWNTDLRQDRFKRLGLCLGACNFPMGELYQSLEVWMCRRGGVLDRDMAPYSHVKKAVEWGDRRCNRANLSPGFCMLDEFLSSKLWTTASLQFIWHVLEPPAVWQKNIPSNLCNYINTFLQILGQQSMPNNAKQNSLYG